MRIQSLEAFGVHGDLLSAWEHYYGPHLLPVQAAAVAEAGVLSGRSVIVCAPTGAGKTLIGEMAALRAATEGQRAVYLVPTKALAEEKYSLLAHISDISHMLSHCLWHSLFPSPVPPAADHLARKTRDWKGSEEDSARIEQVWQLWGDSRHNPAWA